eukprot:COSAG03_NODE_11870_length_572_cov_1.704017_1_plen_102_part_10
MNAFTTMKLAKNPAPHTDFSDLYQKMSGRGESAVLSPNATDALAFGEGSQSTHSASGVSIPMRVTAIQPSTVMHTNREAEASPISSKLNSYRDHVSPASSHS